MPRRARFVHPGVPHHVVQRGNRRGQVFFTAADRHAYLKWLREYASLHGLEVLAYCLMSNHVHLVGVPAHKDSLQLTLRCLHTRYAQCLNRRKEWNGHVWQGRYFASVLDEAYFWAAIRYVERNPVRAGIVRRAEDYAWSSARAHCGLRTDHVISVSPEWTRQVARVKGWSGWLAAGDDPDRLTEIRRHTSKGLPCGSAPFIESLEAASGRRLRPGTRGRPWPQRLAI